MESKITVSGIGHDENGQRYLVVKNHVPADVYARERRGAKGSKVSVGSERTGGNGTDVSYVGGSSHT